MKTFFSVSFYKKGLRFFSLLEVKSYDKIIKLLLNQ